LESGWKRAPYIIIILIRVATVPRDRNSHRCIEFSAFTVLKTEEIADLLFEEPLNNEEQRL
jgi:hypothetical protein